MVISFRNVLCASVPRKNCQKVPLPQTMLNIQAQVCTGSVAGAVDGLHLIASQGDRILRFSLTPKMGSVERNRSLTRSEVFPVGAASGARARSPLLTHCKVRAEGGPVRVYSKALVEANSKN